MKMKIDFCNTLQISIYCFYSLLISQIKLGSTLLVMALVKAVQQAIKVKYQKYVPLNVRTWAMLSYC